MEKIRMETPIDTIPTVSRLPRRQSRSSIGDRSSLKSVSATKAELIPLFGEKSQADWPRLLVQKLQLCSIVYDFDTEGQVGTGQEVKQRTLIELCEHALTHPQLLAPTAYEHIFRMFERNVLRPLPPRTNPTGDEYDPEEDEPILELSWPHLQLVYPFFIKFLESPCFDAASAKRFLDQRFILKLIPLFDSEDPRERDMLKTTLHRIYGKMLGLRQFIRTCLQQVFDECSTGESQHNLAELLEILGSIINGFAVPLKDEHRDFLAHHLLPLHKCRHLATYYSQLAYCIVQFIEKETKVSTVVINALLRYWPRMNSIKEVMFVNELEEVLDLMPDTLLTDSVVTSVLRRVEKCVASLHFQVAERALYMWNDARFAAGILRRHQQTALPLLVPALLQQANRHWNRNVQGLIFKALKTLMDINPELYNACTRTAPFPPTLEHRNSPKMKGQAEGLRGSSASSAGPRNAAEKEAVQFDMPQWSPPTGSEQPEALAESGQRLRRKSVLPIHEQLPLVERRQLSKHQEGGGAL